MKKVNGKSRLVIGCAALIAAGILVSCFLLRYQKDWIMLAGIIVFGILFLNVSEMRKLKIIFMTDCQNTSIFYLLF